MDKKPITLRKRANEAYGAIQRLDRIFKNNTKLNTISIIMLAIEDAYRQGKADALAPKTIIERDS